MATTPPDPASVLDRYIADFAPGDNDAVRALDAVIREAVRGLIVDIKYNILLYAFPGDSRHWVVSIDAHPKSAIGLRFLWGVLLADERKVLRGGSSVLKTWDLKRDRPIDVEAVRAYVAEAASLYDHYRANEKEIEAKAKADAVAGGRRKPGA